MLTLSFSIYSSGGGGGGRTPTLRIWSSPSWQLDCGPARDPAYSLDCALIRAHRRRRAVEGSPPLAVARRGSSGARATLPVARAERLSAAEAGQACGSEAEQATAGWAGPQAEQASRAEARQAVRCSLRPTAPHARAPRCTHPLGGDLGSFSSCRARR